MRGLGADRRGSALIEFAATAPVLLMLAVGAAFTGAGFDRYFALQQLARAAANMHSAGVDFSLPEQRALLSEISSGLDLGAEGDTVVYLSTIADTPDGMRMVRRFRVGTETVGSSTVSSAKGQYDGAVVPPAEVELDFQLSAGQRSYVVEAVHDPTGLFPPGVLGDDFRFRVRAVY